MKIVILDGYTLNPGDLSWAWLEEFGEVVYYDRTAIEEVPRRCKGADMILTNKVQLRADALRQLPSLKYIGVTATGYNIIDVDAAKAQGIVVSNAPAYGTASVVQTTFALLLGLCQHVQQHSDSVYAGAWSRCPDFSYSISPLVGLSGKTMGIIGYGDIGKGVGKVAAAFGMRLMTIRRPSNAASAPALELVSLDQLLAASDVVSLHCPLTTDTQGMINRITLEKMNQSAFLINTSRGALVVEEDLAAALNEGMIAGAGLDVLSQEPPPVSNPLLKAKNCIITPHIAWATREARFRLMEMTRMNLMAFVKGRPENVVNR
ncbi:D-2-hydroxyacid dehydrogenase [Puia sp. P3]|uniref:D-2-hydroxyacid dehydrogenase n=1 Tax=Puia sp. P3 TaxID=3423952 RepID=UPI003D67619E